jgi:23S rRNA (uridine2552-2'-O)-methyltransferase
MARSKSSQKWLEAHFSDPFVQRSWRDGLRSRAAYKLIELQEKDKILAPGKIIVDLGAAPGGWSQVASQAVGQQGKVIALDILPMQAIMGVEFIQGDFTEDATLTLLQASVKNMPIDLVLSDMAPNMSGISSADQARSMYLAKLASQFAGSTLTEGGDFLVKVFQGAGFDEYKKELQTKFKRVVVRKPSASRTRSREVYLLARGFMAHPCATAG